ELHQFVMLFVISSQHTYHLSWPTALILQQLFPKDLNQDFLMLFLLEYSDWSHQMARNSNNFQHLSILSSLLLFKLTDAFQNIRASAGEFELNFLLIGHAQNLSN